MLSNVLNKLKPAAPSGTYGPPTVALTKVVEMQIRDYW